MPRGRKSFLLPYGQKLNIFLVKSYLQNHLFHSPLSNRLTVLQTYLKWVNNEKFTNKKCFKQIIPTDNSYNILKKSEQQMKSPCNCLASAHLVNKYNSITIFVKLDQEREKFERQVRYFMTQSLLLLFLIFYNTELIKRYQPHNYLCSEFNISVSLYQQKRSVVHYFKIFLDHTCTQYQGHIPMRKNKQSYARLLFLYW